MGDDPVKIIAGGAASNLDRKLERLCGPQLRKDSEMKKQGRQKTDDK
ncbi:hypothetical protein HR059_26365 (plasmid) [Sinorhizobium meliloti WSM1022]|nr:hypothetical protein [Sinorhizobium meliloti]QKN17765.1 hypothetical protein HR059_26365 [Sinorhizobium meliloti WSM1022]